MVAGESRRTCSAPVSRGAAPALFASSKIRCNSSSGSAEHSFTNARIFRLPPPRRLKAKAAIINFVSSHFSSPFSSDIGRRHLLHAFQRLTAVDPGELQPVKGAPVSHFAGQFHIGHNISAHGVDAEKRLPISLWLNANQGRPGLGVFISARQGRLLFDGGSLDECGYGQFPTELFVDRGHQAGDRDGVAAEFEDRDGSVQRIRPDPDQFRLSGIARGDGLDPGGVVGFTRSRRGVEIDLARGGSGRDSMKTNAVGIGKST